MVMMDVQFLDLSLLRERVENIISYCGVESFAEGRAVGWRGVTENDHVLGSCDVFARKGLVHRPSWRSLGTWPSRTVAVMKLMVG